MIAPLYDGQARLCEGTVPRRRLDSPEQACKSRLRATMKRLCLIACVSCSAGQLGLSESNSAEKERVAPQVAALSSAVGARSGRVPQHDPACAPECAIQSVRDCPRSPMLAIHEELLQTGPNASIAEPPVLVSREHFVEVQRTPLTGSEAAKRLARAYRRELGHEPSQDTLAVLTAHWAHETNQGTAMYNYNFGGIKGIGPSGAYAIHRTREGKGLREQRIQTRFRAYARATEGAVDYVALLQRRYSGALQAAARGDVAGFVSALRQGGYFSGDEDIYLQKVAAFVALSKEWGFDAVGPSGISPKHLASREKV